MKIGELRTTLRELEKTELVEILVEMYKTLPKSQIDEKSIDNIIRDRNAYLEARKREKKIATDLARAYPGENVTSIEAMQRWKAIPERGREILLDNVWCSHCKKARWLKEYTVEPVGPDIVLRGKCPVCHHGVARYVEID